MRTFVCPVRDVPRCHCFCHMRTSASARGDRVGVPEPRSSEGFCQDSAVSTRTSCELWSRTAGLPEELDSTVHDACVTSARSSWEFGFPALPAAPGGPRPGRGFDVWHVPAASGPPRTPASYSEGPSMWDTLIPLVCPRACSSPGLPSLCGRLAHSAGTFALQGWGGRVTPGPAVCASGSRLYAAGSC